ncbi:Digestive organ expansion factor [Amanita muscaria]
MTSHTPSPAYQIESQSRFLTDGKIQTCKGNVDDNFKVGLEMTRKSVMNFTIQIIIASPLGLRRSIEKEKGADYLSSIEILIMDQMEALTMQSHVKSILISAYETPETRSFYKSALKNVAGNIRTEKRWPPVDVPEGSEQANRVFRYSSTHCLPAEFHSLRLFEPKTIPPLRSFLQFKSAVQSTNTAIFVPSSFDFIRIQNYFRKHAGVSCTVLSEYSTNQDITRARLAFFEGKILFLLISERFHFYRRYKIRGIRNLIFYGPPNHPQFFTELRRRRRAYDWFRLERIAGTNAAAG